MTTLEKFAWSLLLAFAFFALAKLMKEHTRNTARNREIEKVLEDFGEYELESDLAL
jgi:predicted outer membrane lipoprotein